MPSTEVGHSVFSDVVSSIVYFRCQSCDLLNLKVDLCFVWRCTEKTISSKNLLSGSFSIRIHVFKPNLFFICHCRFTQVIQYDSVLYSSISRVQLGKLAHFFCWRLTSLVIVVQAKCLAQHTPLLKFFTSDLCFNTHPVLLLFFDYVFSVRNTLKFVLCTCFCAVALLCTFVQV